MDNNTVSRLQTAGISEKRAKQLATPSLASTCEALLTLFTELKIVTVEATTASLLDELVSNSVATHRLVVAKYIVDKKMTRQNLTAALRYLKTAGDVLDTQKFEQECGIGVVVNAATLAEKLDEITKTLDQTKFADANAFNRQVMTAAKDHPVLKWADGKLLNDSVKAHCQTVFQVAARAKVVAAPKAAAVDEGQLDPSKYKELRINSCNHYITKMKEFGPNFSLYREKKAVGAEQEVFQKFPNSDAQVSVVDADGTTTSAEKALQTELYPHKFVRNPTGKAVKESEEHLKLFLEEFAPLTNGETSNQLVTITGRITCKREASKNLVFYDISEGGHSLQILCNYLWYHVVQMKSSHVSNWSLIHETLRRGDVIGVEGFPCRSKTGELSIAPAKILLLTPCFHNLPPDNSLKDMETRYRYRHIDMLVNSNVVNTFKWRSILIQEVRKYFNDKGFLEVETPTMGVLAGGATARPFITKHNSLGINLFMRVAPELYLKQLIIGGMHKVFEIGKNYRNEGIDLTHNPEFTAIEVYEAYADYEDWIAKTEELIYHLVVDVINKDKPADQKEILVFHPQGKPEHNGDDKPCYTLNFKRPWARYPLIQTLEERLSKEFGEEIKFPADLSTKETTQFLIALCKRAEAECDPPHTTPRLIDALVGDYIEADLVNPSFITDHPQIMSPLAKYHRKFPTLTERFELFIAKKEICNSYTELNDPARQRACFQAQILEKNEGDKEAQPPDEGFCTALEYGLPPTGGWGMGIDRLTMMLTDSYNIKEVILFPAMRPLEDQIEAQKSILSALNKDD